MASTQQANVERLYREVGAGGFSHVDGTVQFYQRINALIGPEMKVLDLGAGRGEQLLSNESPYRTALCKLQGKVRHLVGVDVDRAVMDNPFLDEAHVIDPERPFPFADATFDLIYADWVLEHVATPDAFVAEVSRLLKPGGWFCARTPNRWGMTGIATNLIPNSMHVRLLKRLQPGRAAQDVFPTVYAMNTLGRIGRYFAKDGWIDHSYISNSEPPYVQGSAAMMRAVKMLWRVSPSFFHTVINVFVRKR